MYSILKSVINGKQDDAASDTAATSPDPSSSDPWLFTDPCARDLYMKRDRIGELEEDIRTYVMFDGCWAPEELEYKLEVRRLLGEGLIAPTGRFGYLSPHPTVYHILKEGMLVISGRQYAFQDGEDLMFEPWLARYAEPGLKATFRVGCLHDVSSPCLCCDVFPQVCIHCNNTLTIMRQILNYQNREL